MLGKILKGPKLTKISPNKTISQKGRVPNLIGLPLMDALPIIENSGLKVKISGRGFVVKQAPKPNTPLKKGSTVFLKLN